MCIPSRADSAAGSGVQLVRSLNAAVKVAFHAGGAITGSPVILKHLPGTLEHVPARK